VWLDNCTNHVAGPKVSRQPEENRVKHISLDDQPPSVQQFVVTLPLDADGSLLELKGSPVLRVLPATGEEPVDEAKLKAAILARRDSSRALNAEWEDVDREVWDREE
jgi:hypothetical protein